MPPRLYGLACRLGALAALGVLHLHAVQKARGVEAGAVLRLAEQPEVLNHRAHQFGVHMQVKGYHVIVRGARIAVLIAQALQYHEVHAITLRPMLHAQAYEL